MLVYQRVPHTSYLVTLLAMKGVPQPYFGDLVTMVINHLHPLGAHPPSMQLRWRPGGLSEVGLFDLFCFGVGQFYREKNWVTNMDNGHQYRIFVK